MRAESKNIMCYSNHYDSFRQWTPRLHCWCIPCLHPSPSPDWSDIYSDAFCRNWQGFGPKSASFPFRPSPALPNCFLSIHKTDQMSLPQSQTQPPTPLAFQIPLLVPRPPVNPAPGLPTPELPLLLLCLCDNNNNCVVVQRAFCWASARPAGTGNPLSLFHHLQPIPLCLGWHWSITGIKAAINVLSSRGHQHHSRTRSISSLSTSLFLSHSIWNPVQKRLYWQDK